MVGLVPAFVRAQSAPETAQDVVKRVAAALGVERFPLDHPGTKATGKAIWYGIETDVEFILDGKGRFRLSYGGPVSEVRVFDGVEAWVNDWTGACHHLLLADRDLALMTAWVTSGYWAARPELFE